jgi:hypothetical protein
VTGSSARPSSSSTLHSSLKWMSLRCVLDQLEAPQGLVSPFTMCPSQVFFLCAVDVLMIVSGTVRLS